MEKFRPKSSKIPKSKKDPILIRIIKKYDFEKIMPLPLKIFYKKFARIWEGSLSPPPPPQGIPYPYPTPLLKPRPFPGNYPRTGWRITWITWITWDYLDYLGLPGYCSRDNRLLFVKQWIYCSENNGRTMVRTMDRWVHRLNIPILFNEILYFPNLSVHSGQSGLHISYFEVLLVVWGFQFYQITIKTWVFWLTFWRYENLA